jgi:tetratricopeptide (TPR) repeat protein
MTEPSLPEESIFAQALEIRSAPKRAAFLDQVCADNAALRAEVEALLRAHERSGDLLDVPDHAVPTCDLPADQRPGTVIDRYKLLEHIGEGGMGTVWMAEQSDPIQRRVALKVVKEGMDTKHVLARFEAERQALALMEHPNIARVFDAGRTPSGRPYFVMELVKGRPITKYCDEKRLGVRQRLELFADVCRAAQHAHQKGVIHRDLKPSNVLVAPYDGRPVAKVIDFGVAKATGRRLTEQTLFTGFGAVVGTPEYMSPEQAEVNNQDIDTRSDIYALGVLLYELLTGSTPLTRKRAREVALLEVLRVIREEEPPRPSTRLAESKDTLPSISAQRQTEPAKLTKLVKGELDWIVMKALEKDRNRRYETANAFALDVQRYLADEAVQACPPSGWYRLRKFVRRHRGAVLAASLVLVALLAGMVGTTWGLLRAEHARDAEASANAAAHKRLAQIERGNQILASIFHDLDPRAEQKGGKPLRMLLGERLDAAVQQLRGEAVGDPLVVARLQGQLGESLAGLGYAEKARGVFDECRRTFTALSGPTARETLQAMNDLANTYHDLARNAEAVRLYAETLALQKSALGADDRDTLVTMNNLANAYDALGRRADALKLRKETLARRRATVGPDHPDTLMSMHNLANSYEAVGRLADALRLRKDTLAARRIRLGPDHYDTLMSMNNLANTYDTFGRYAEALKLRREALAARRATLGPDHPDTLVSMANLANSYYNLGRHADAVQLHEKTLKLMTAKLGRAHPGTLLCMNALAADYTVLGRRADAVKLFEEVLALRQSSHPDHSETLVSMNNLTAAYAAIGRHADALRLSKQTLALMRSRLGPDHALTLVARLNLAASYADVGRHAEAVALDEKTLTLMQRQVGPQHPYTLQCMRNLAASYRALRRYAGALRRRQELLDLTRARLGRDHPDTLSCMNELALSYAALDRHAEALKLREKVLAHRRATLGRDHPDTLASMIGVANVYHVLGRHPEALKLREETLPLCRARLGRDHADTLATMHNLANSYDALGRDADALKLHQQTLRLKESKLGPNHPDTLLTMWGLVCSLVKLDRGAEAVPVIDDCVRRAAGRPVHPNLFPALLEMRLRHFQKTRDAAGCRTTAEMWEDLKRTDPAGLYNAARMRAVTAAVHRAGDSSERAAEADRAMAWLRQAVASGYRDLARLKQDKDLDGLRDREDFRSLLAGLGAQGKGSGVRRRGSRKQE